MIYSAIFICLSGKSLNPSCCNRNSFKDWLTEKGTSSFRPHARSFPVAYNQVYRLPLNNLPKKGRSQYQQKGSLLPLLAFSSFKIINRLFSFLQGWVIFQLMLHTFFQLDRRKLQKPYQLYLLRG